MIRAVAAEWLKLTSTRMPVWTAVAVTLLGLAVALALGYTAYPLSPMFPDKAATGVALLGVPALMAAASMTVTGEYRSGLIRTTFLATPNRAMVLCAKAVVAAVFSAVVAGVATVLAVLAAGAVAAPGAAVGLNPTAAASWQTAGAVAVFAALAAVLAVGVGALVREAAAAVAVLLMWPLVIETVLGTLPSISDRVGPYLPFANGLAFTGTRMFAGPYAMAWDRLGSLAYLTAVVAVVFGAGLVVIVRRDA